MLDPVQSEAGRPVSIMGLLSCVLGVAEIAAGHFSGVFHLVCWISKLDSGALKTSPRRLLEKTSALESVDPGRAMTLYRQIALSFPGTSEGEEANRKLQLLRERHRESKLEPKRRHTP
jgi:hypothetical protein